MAANKKITSIKKKNFFYLHIKPTVLRHVFNLMGHKRFISNDLC